MINPYYSHNGITIYHGDCRKILPDLPNVDLVLTDPPYGIGFRYGGEYQDKAGGTYMELIAPLKGRPLALLQYPEEMMRYCVPVLGPPDECFIWCYNSNNERQSRIWGFWNVDVDWMAVKQPPQNPTDKRIASTPKADGVRHYDWCSNIQQVKNVSNDKTDHPCQLPIELVNLIILFCNAGTIIDPFMGSGTTLRAAKDLGRKAIGIDIEEKYCKIAIQRLRQEVLPLVAYS